MKDKFPDLPSSSAEVDQESSEASIY
jgi:hypothetical protein